MAIKTTYEVRRPQDQFYSVQKMGYVTVADAVTDAVNGILTQGAMRTVNVTFFDSTVTSSGGTATASPRLSWMLPNEIWPPRERLYTLVNPGIGYKPGDQIEVVGRTDSNIAEARFTANIVSTVTSNGAIRSFHMIRNAPLANSALSPSGTISTEFSVWSNNNQVRFTHLGTTIANVNNVTGVTLNSTPINPATLTVTQVGQWPTQYGDDTPTLPGGGGGTLGSRWPQNGFLIPWTRNVYVGQVLELDDTVSNSQSLIPPGTVITAISNVNVITGTGSSGGTPVTYFETTSVFLNIQANANIRLSKNDRIRFRGTGATFENWSNIRTPSNFRVLLETTGAIDPLSDQNGVSGNVHVTTTNSNVVLITNLAVSGNTWTPQIYAGQQITSTNSITGTITTPLFVDSVEPAVFTAGSFITGRTYTIKTAGNTSFATIGSLDNSVGSTFVATGAGSGTGTAIDRGMYRVGLSRNHSFSQASERLNFVFAETQPWRLMFDVLPNTTNPGAGSQSCVVYAATDLQLTDDTNYANIYNSTGTTIIDRAGLMGNIPSGIGGSISTTDSDEGFLNRERRVSLNPGVYPLNFMLTLTNRGMFFGMWEGNWSTLQKTRASIVTDRDNYFNWFLIQRPVNRVTGQVLTTGNAPVFCINSVGYRYWKFIVREADAMHPTQGPADCRSFVANTAPGATTANIQFTPYRSPADAHSTDSFAVLNTSNQLALTEDSKYLVSFLHNLSTPRFRYSEELDMMGQTSADVCGAGLDISINAYQEYGLRKYRALPANGPYNSGLRICVLKDLP